MADQTLSFSDVPPLPGTPLTVRMYGVSAQLFQQFAQSVKQQLEAAPGAAGEAAPPPPASQPIRILPLLLRTLWAAIVRFFRR